MLEYKLIDTGSRKEAEKELEKASQEGWELLDFRTGGNWIVYHYVFLLKRSSEATSDE